ncbi:M50 family metallopeptidase [Cellulomonas edaphi]|uniref:Site-2 protease family protein n=1 Tax=Cellulomonas edaphi TaxID=3053468 RepID=A0ABT7SAR1_9CELL|nr:site-2 protease family protein [Cellulomons edaphi]MDM7832712.1 site-2 protease family protein [Cellulomons edaphi]
MTYLAGVLVFVVVLLLSIGLHEIGHMVPAKRFGVRVSQYMVGFGPTLWSRTKGETEYGLKAIPLGGYVRLVGMYAPDEAVGSPPADTWYRRLARDARRASAEEIHPGEDARAFYHLSTPKKVTVMLGGPVMNLVIAFVLLGIVAVGFGTPTNTPTVSTVSQCVIPADAAPDRECLPTDPAAPGAAAGLLPGDTVVSYDGVAITSWNQLTTAIRATGDDPTPIVVERDGTRVALTVTPVVAQRPVVDKNGLPVKDAAGNPKTAAVGFLGISPTEVMERRSPLAVPGIVADTTWQTISVVGTLPGRVVDLAQTTFSNEERDANSLVGVVGIGRFAGEIASADDVTEGIKASSLLTILAVLNISLFVFNLIPLPPLDGGHVAAALWEGAHRQVARVRGRARPGPSDSAKLVPIAYAVFVVLGAVGLLLVYADLFNPIVI